MKAKITSLEVVEEGILGLTHGFTSKIKELIVQDLNLCVNEKYAFISYEQEMTFRIANSKEIKEIELSEAEETELKQLVEIIKIKNEIHKKYIGHFNLDKYEEQI